VLETVNADGENVSKKGKYRLYAATSLPTGRSLELGSNPYVKVDYEVI
jgi:hypothetical protein